MNRLEVDSVSEHINQHQDDESRMSDKNSEKVLSTAESNSDRLSPADPHALLVGANHPMGTSSTETDSVKVKLCSFNGTSTSDASQGNNFPEFDSFSDASSKDELGNSQIGAEPISQRRVAQWTQQGPKWVEKVHPGPPPLGLPLPPPSPPLPLPPQDAPSKPADSSFVNNVDMGTNCNASDYSRECLDDVPICVKHRYTTDNHLRSQVTLKAARRDSNLFRADVTKATYNKSSVDFDIPSSSTCEDKSSLYPSTSEDTLNSYEVNHARKVARRERKLLDNFFRSPKRARKPDFDLPAGPHPDPLVLPRQSHVPEPSSPEYKHRSFLSTPALINYQCSGRPPDISG